MQRKEEDDLMHNDEPLRQKLEFKFKDLQAVITTELNPSEMPNYQIEDEAAIEYENEEDQKIEYEN